LITKFKQIEQYLEPPFVVESVPRATKATGSAAAKEEEDENAEAGENEGASLSASEKEEAETAQRKSGKLPSLKGRAKEPEIVEKNTARELFDYVLNEGRKEYTVQRYKGLGEMTAEQLWETTMDPERRTLLQVRLEDIAECETIFTTLMGEDVEARRKFIEDNALDVKNLDI
jgi:DNA gyrase subunit B